MQINKEIHITNLPIILEEDELRNLFTKFGEITNIYIPQEAGCKKCRGFAFIEFASKQAAENAIKEMNGYEYKGRLLNVVHAKEKSRCRGRW